MSPRVKRAFRVSRNTKRATARAERGIALLIVVSVLTVIGIMGVAFAFSMYLETQATKQFVATTQARYLAESGVAYGRALLDEDRLGSRADDLTEAWAQVTKGRDADVDNDGVSESRWWPVTDAKTQTVGRFAALITDESGKANLNAAQAEPSVLGPGAINLTTLLERAGVRDPSAAAQAIERYRYGEDQRPGVAGVDDDGDGVIDNVEEYQPLALRGDDRRLESLDELVAIAGLTPEQVHRLSKLATVYSRDVNRVTSTGGARLNVNTATTNELLSVLLDAGVDDPWQAAVNIADYVDPDLDLSRVIKDSQTLSVPDQGPLGTWTWSETPEGHYVSTVPGGTGISWSAAVPTGTFRVLARGLQGIKVGDVTIAGQFRRSVDSGESLGTFPLSGTLTIEVANHEPNGTTCAFRGIDLVLEGSENGGVVRGIEAVRFNELMVEPSIELNVAAAAFDPQGSGWVCPPSAVCQNSGVGQGRWTWTSPLLEPGRYYVRVFGASSGQIVGDVRVEGSSKRLVHGQSHSSTLAVGSDGKVSLTIGKTDPEQTYYLRSITLSVQPDAEYAELINLSDHDIDVGGWTIDGDLAGGRQAKLPSGARIKAHGLLVAAVDLDDSQEGLSANGISARSAWHIGDAVNAVQLVFPGGPPTQDDDWLKVTRPSGSTSGLALHSGSMTVDQVEYPLPLPTTSGFQSLEKGDPTVIVDKNGNGLDEGWFPSLQLYTPGLPNDNEGLKEHRGLETIVHDPAKEITILNRPLASIGELAGVPSGKAWKPFASADLAKIVDRLTVEGLRLESQGRLVAGEEAWQEKAQGYYEYNSTDQPAIAGTWRWTNIPPGRYRLSVYGWPGEQVSVRWEQRDEAFTQWSPGLSSDAGGRVVIGQITVSAPGSTGAQGPPDATPPNTLTLEAKCASPSGICHLANVRLDPQLIRLGPVNLNTAPLDVLEALPGMTDALASRIIAHRPYGDQEQKGRGIGDLLIGDVLGSDEEEKLAVFRRLAHLLTTRSDLFQILSIGQAGNGTHVKATQRILTVVER